MQIERYAIVSLAYKLTGQIYLQLSSEPPNSDSDTARDPSATPAPSVCAKRSSVGSSEKGMNSSGTSRSNGGDGDLVGRERVSEPMNERTSIPR